MTDLEQYFMNRFIKVIDNQLPVTDSPYKYRHPDLYKLATKAKEEGKEYFYYKPLDPDKPNGKQIESKPIYKYHLNLTITQEEYDELIDKYVGEDQYKKEYLGLF